MDDSLKPRCGPNDSHVFWGHCDRTNTISLAIFRSFTGSMVCNRWDVNEIEDSNFDAVGSKVR
jgi:hypothetical protein